VGARYDVNLSGLALPMKMIAEFRPLIRTAIAETINSLSDSNTTIHWTLAYTLSNLSQQGYTAKFPGLAFAHNLHS
jgi:hypothetical protein